MLDPNVAGLGASGLRPEGTVVLLLMGPVDRKWAADAAVELSAEWAEGGRRIVLADLHLENPLLHAGLDVSNLEGLVDIFLYGASLSRIARPVRDGAFYFIPAGTYAPDIDEIYRHPRWKKLVAGFRDTGATLILFAPADGTHLESLAEWSSETIVLGPPPGPELSRELERVGIRVLAVLEPPAIAPTVDRPTTEPAASTPVVSAEAPLVTPSAAVAARPPVTVHRRPESELELPPPTARRRQERRSTSFLLWLLLAVMVLVTAAYLLLSIRPDLLPNGGVPQSGDGSAASTGALSAAPAPTRQGELLPYSVQVKAFTSFTAALEETAAIQRRVPSSPFFISPEEVQGILYYRIFSGVSTDTLAASSLRDRLVELGLVDAEDAVGAWSLIQFTPLAFDLGEFNSEEAAALRADSLRQREIPAYSTVVPYSDGSKRWQLYGGAYRDSASADGMRDRLLAAGVESRLAARAGLPATLPE